MKCLKREELFAYVHHLLEPREEGEARAHLGQCAACRELLHEYESLDAVLDEWKPAEPSPWFDTRVRAAVAAAEPARAPYAFFGLRWTRWLAPAFVVILVVTASLTVFRTHRPPKGAGPVVAEKAARATQPAQAVAEAAPAAQDREDELVLYENLPLLENYDMLANFDVLSELPKGGKKVAN